MTGDNKLDFIEFFISRYKDFAENDGKIWGGYGPRFRRWHGQDQIENVVSLLSRKPTSRQAVLQIFDATDIAERRRDTPCTCSIQFLIRRGKLCAFVSMRSNDAWIGLPHDVFAFTMLQEFLACRLGIDLGWYKHSVASMHIYERDVERAKLYLDEGWQPTVDVEMPRMPFGDVETDFCRLLAYERAVRSDSTIDPDSDHGYWRDLQLVLKAHSIVRNNGGQAAIESIYLQLTSEVFRPYLHAMAARLVAD